MKRNRSLLRTGFTLTEILIALALVSFLLVGVSYIFTATSTTISTGQATSAGLRTQRAIQQILSNDFIGYSSTGSIAESDENSGMAPLVVDTGTSNGAPYLSISNYRISAFANQRDRTSGSYSPPDVIPSYNFKQHSESVRLVDDPANGPTRIPIFSYGYRNYRSDSIGFFAKGLFRTQTSPAPENANDSPRYKSDLTSKAAFIWWGHARIFNGTIALENDPSVYGSPGNWMIPDETNGSTFRPNQNNRFANQFTLARMQMLLVEPEAAGFSNIANTYDYLTVTDAAGQYLPFVRRNWNNPGDNLVSNTSLSPLNIGSPVVQYRQSNQMNVQLHALGAPRFNEGFSGGKPMTMHMGRTDIVGADIEGLRARATELDAMANPSVWRDTLPKYWNNRPLVNPFMPSSQDPNAEGQFSARSMSQRQQIVADGVTQFIVEFAGDFITQDPASGAYGGPVSDGIIDFIVVDDVRQVRWYGMPRDVDGDNVIDGVSPDKYTSPDVIPLRDVTGAADVAIEDISFAAQRNYLDVGVSANTTEPNPGTSPNDSSYRCVWGPKEFDNPTTINGVDCYRVPQMIRVIVDVGDPKGQKDEVFTQEYIFPVKVK